MLESLVSFKDINERPYIMAVWAFIICSIAVLISSQVPVSVPGTNTGFLVVMFTIIPSTYFITLFIKKEEMLEEQYAAGKDYDSRFWVRHEKDIMILLFFFVGLTLSFAVWSVFMPQAFFQAQITKINAIQSIATGSVADVATGHAVDQFGTFTRILQNNLQVMTFSFIFSFIFGAGAIFIIVWNASVLGVYIGQLSRFVWQIPIVSLSFIPHGVPEIAGYLVAGLAGGLISAAVIRKNTSRTLRIITFDVVKLLIIAIVLIVVGAGIEAYLA
jgi:uncharacterized membrane protein SpoIIM required for sporulation